MNNLIYLMLILIGFVSNTARAAEKEGAPSSSSPQKIDVDALKERYWRNNAPDLNVIQNRTYTKVWRLNLQVFGANLNHDPFLTTYAIGGSVGMNFTEYLGLHFLFWKMYESNSPAVAALQNAETLAGGSVYGANVNPIQSLIGGELSWAILYGKLSLLGKAILHFDLFLMGGAGSVSTQNGSSIAPWIGIGQQIYLTRFLALRADLRYLTYQENLVEQNNVSDKGAILNSRSTSCPMINIGFSVYLF